jgi:hypothetical protein
VFANAHAEPPRRLPDRRVRSASILLEHLGSIATRSGDIPVVSWAAAGKADVNDPSARKRMKPRAEPADAGGLRKDRSGSRTVRTRNVIVDAIVLVVVTVATMVFIVDTPAWDDETPPGLLAPVIISTEAIPANQLLDPLIDQGIFEEIQLPAEARVDGAIVDVRQLYGMTTVIPIFANELMSSAWLTAGGSPSPLGPNNS